MAELKKFYRETVVKKLMEELGYKNPNQVPTIKNVVVNVGIASSNKDNGFIDTIETNLKRITGQKPVKTLAKKAISNFKIRQGMVVGMKVTMRGQRMWDFVEKLIKITLPRVKDFRGISPNAFDGQGNYSIGFKEHLAFPEVRPDDIERVHGLEVNISTSAKSNKEGLLLLEMLGFPFKKD
jgi:large subunit ribosomal protein L5